MRTLSNKMSKLAAKPASGIYYAVPTSRAMNSWEIRYRRDDEGWKDEQLLHFDMWEQVAENVERTLKLEVPLGDNYTGLPRGRISSPEESGGDKWIISHGGDTPGILKHQVLGAFGLLSLIQAGKVEWNEVDHEQMNPTEKEEVWSNIKTK